MTLRLLRVWVWLELLAVATGLGYIGAMLAQMANETGPGGVVVGVVEGAGAALVIVAGAILWVVALVEFFNHPWGRP